MFIAFDQISDAARVWIYQANRPLSDGETAGIEKALAQTIADWNAHGQPLLGSAKVIYNRFVVIAADETANQPSGCSIDASTRWIKQIGEQADIDFFDRSVAFVGKNGIETVSVSEAKAAVLSQKIMPNTLTFNNLVKTKAELLQNWETPAVESWLKRFFVVKQMA